LGLKALNPNQERYYDISGHKRPWLGNINLPHVKTIKITILASSCVFSKGSLDPVDNMVDFQSS